VALPAVLRPDQPPDVAARADEGDRHRDGLPGEQVGERDGQAEGVQRARDPEPGVQEGAPARREVEAVADQPVVGGLADPREVLELIRGEQTVRARQGPALGQQRGEDDDREPREDNERAELDAVEPEGPAPARRGRRRPDGVAGGHRHRSRGTSEAASSAIRPVIFDRPSRRSWKTIGTSTTRRPERRARQVSSIWKP
jgi:hypothetical protein